MTTFYFVIEKHKVCLMHEGYYKEGAKSKTYEYCGAFEPVVRNFIPPSAVV